MTTLKLELSEETAEWLAAAAARKGVSPEEAAADWLAQLAWEEERPPLSEEDIAAIEEGIADADAGRVYSSQEVRAALGLKD
jgi:predicted transcriptional regulator